MPIIGPKSVSPKKHYEIPLNFNEECVMAGNFIPILNLLCRIRCPHSGSYECCHLLGYSAV
jgi:hypothetical protein